MSNFTLILTAVLLSLTFGLSACGGGGGGTEFISEPGPSEPRPLSELEPSEPRPLSEQQATLGTELINAHSAYSRNLTGQGVTIGYYEDAIDKSNPELAGKIIDNRYDEIEPGTYNNLWITLEEATEHATQLATVAVGKRDDRGVHGIAYGSKLEFVALQNAEFNRQTARQFDLAGRGEIPLRDVQGNTAQAINYLSARTPIAFTALTGIEDYSALTPAEAEPIADFTGQLTALRQASTAAAAKTIWVFSAGNRSMSHPESEGYLPVHFPELRGHVVAAVAVDESGVIADYSNRCGDAKVSCIAVPGEHRVPIDANDYIRTSGTSSAAATVASALAILKQSFPSIGNDEILQRLYSTADKSGHYADRSIYGQGLVDLDTATRPVGTLQLMSAGDIGGQYFSAPQSSIFTAAPFGDAFPQVFKGRQVMLLDRLNAPFVSEIAAFVQAQSIDYSRRHLNDLFDRLQSPVPTPSANQISEWMRMAGIRMSFDSVSLAFSEDSRTALSKTFSVFPKKFGSTLTLAALHEPDSALGTHTKGAFGRQRAASLAAQLRKQRKLLGWNTAASIAASLTSVHASGGIIRSASPVLASSVALTAQRQTDFGVFHVSVTQPLRIEAGHVQVRYPSARTPDRQVVYQSFQADLAPSGRQLDFEIGATRSMSSSARYGISLRATRDPGHIDQAPAIFGVSLGFASSF